jgi:hypothetical protein
MDKHTLNALEAAAQKALNGGTFMQALAAQRQFETVATPLTIIELVTFVRELWNPGGLIDGQRDPGRIQTGPTTPCPSVLQTVSSAAQG